MMSFDARDFGRVAAGEAKLYTLGLGDARVTLTDYGAAIVSIVVPDRNGNYADVALGYDTAGEYESQGGHLGGFIGRCGNRLANAEFTLNGKQYKVGANERGNCLHGGKTGFDKNIWTACPIENELMTENSTGIRFVLTSPDGHEGFPGKMDVTADYILSRDPESGAISLTLDMKAVSDADTLANFTNHVYINLAGHDCVVNGTTGGILTHRLTLASRFYTPTDANLCPTGEILRATDALDFSRPRMIGQDIDSGDPRLASAKGYDHNFVLDKSERGALDLAATLECSESGRRMELYTTLPGVQLYTSNGLRSRKGKNGAHYDLRQGVCLEPQVFPNAMHCTHFPSPILRKGETYHETIVWKFIAK